MSTLMRLPGFQLGDFFFHEAAHAHLTSEMECSLAEPGVLGSRLWIF